jgi:hypothetical protein
MRGAEATSSPFAYTGLLPELDAANVEVKKFVMYRTKLQKLVGGPIHSEAPYLNFFYILGR